MAVCRCALVWCLGIWSGCKPQVLVQVKQEARVISVLLIVGTPRVRCIATYNNTVGSALDLASYRNINLH